MPRAHIGMGFVSFPEQLRITKRQRAGDSASESDIRSFFTRKKVHVGSEGGREILAVVASFSVSSYIPALANEC